MRLVFNDPLRAQPPTTIVNLPVKAVAANTSLAVLGGVKIPQGVHYFESVVSGVDTAKDVGGYALKGFVKNYPACALPASGTLTITGAISAAETVTIGSVTYTFRASVSTTANEVKIGVDDATTLANLKAAINGAAGGGTTYGSATVAHPTVTAGTNTATTLAVSAITRGTAGNSIATTETMANGSWGAATLGSGADAYQLVGSVVADATCENDSNWTATAAVNGTTGELEVKVTSDGTNITTFTGWLYLLKVQ